MITTLCEHCRNAGCDRCRTTSAPIVMRTPRRIVQKAFDGNAAVNAFLLQNTVAEGYTRMIATAKYLLDAGVCPSDVHKMMGMPLENVRRIGGGAWEGIRVGRVPQNIGRLFLAPIAHLRVSVFLCYIENVTAVTGAESISGEAFASALKATTVMCGSVGAEQASPRYLVLAVLEVSQGTCWLQTCTSCRVRYLRSRVLLRVQSGMYSHGECPFCNTAKRARHESVALSACVSA